MVMIESDEEKRKGTPSIGRTDVGQRSWNPNGRYPRTLRKGFGGVEEKHPGERLSLHSGEPTGEGSPPKQEGGIAIEDR